MAFKKRMIAACDSCPTEIELWAVSKAAANEQLKKDNWLTDGENHLCPKCNLRHIAPETYEQWMMKKPEFKAPSKKQENK